MSVNILDRTTGLDPKRVQHFRDLRARALADAHMRPISHSPEKINFSKVWEANPWSARSFNLTVQMAVIREDPVIAAGLEREARRAEAAL